MAKGGAGRYLPYLGTRRRLPLMRRVFAVLVFAAALAFLGFTDDARRMLPNSVGTTANPYRCAAMANAAGYAYAGIQAGSECWGGRDLSMATMLGMATSCGSCVEASSLRCGRDWSNAIYVPGGCRPAGTHPSH